MPTLAAPLSTRDRAEAAIAREIGGGFSHRTRLEDFGTVRAVQLLLALELEFDILLDVDEVLPDGTLGGLVGLVLHRVQAKRPTPVGAAGNLIDLAQRRAERARRAQADFEIPAPPLEPIALPPEPVDFPDHGPALRRLFALCALGGALAGLVAFTLPHP